MHFSWPFLIASGFLFLGSLPVSVLLGHVVFGWILLLMGGIPLLLAWGRGLVDALPDDPTPSPADPPQEKKENKE